MTNLTAQWRNQSLIGQTVLKMPIVVHNAEFTMTIDELRFNLFCRSGNLWWVNDGFCSMTNCRNRRRIVMEHWPKPIAKRCSGYNRCPWRCEMRWWDCGKDGDQDDAVQRVSHWGAAHSELLKVRRGVVDGERQLKTHANTGSVFKEEWMEDEWMWGTAIVRAWIVVLRIVCWRYSAWFLQRERQVFNINQRPLRYRRSWSDWL